MTDIQRYRFISMVPGGHEGTYFKFQTSEGQAPKEIDFQLDKISVFKGYADLSKASDIDGKNPTMHIPEVPPEDAVISKV